MAKNRIAIIGGTGFEKLLNGTKQSSQETPYGTVSAVFVKKIGKTDVVLLPRHGLDHSVPPHRINYRANIWALHSMSVRQVLATNAVGAINADFKPGDVVVPHDLVDFTKQRVSTFYDEPPVTHIDVSHPYCPEVRNALIDNVKKHSLQVWERAVMACTEGPRFETPAEIRMFRQLGCDIVGMTGYPEVVLAKELGMCYATVCYASNMAAGLQERLTAEEVARISGRILPKLMAVLTDTTRSLSARRQISCRCGQELKSARFKH